MRNIVKSCVLAFMLVFSNCWSSQLMAQTENLACKAVAEQYEKKYNAGDAEGVFAMFNGDMQSALPLEKTKETLNILNAMFGKIKSRTFIRNKDATNVYQVECEKDVATLVISIDANSKINGLLMNPFKKKTEDKNAVNALTDISKEQAKIIFDKAKSFPNKTQLSIAFIENEKVRYYGVIKENDSLKTIDNKEHSVWLVNTSEDLELITERFTEIPAFYIGMAYKYT